MNISPELVEVVKRAGYEVEPDDVEATILFATRDMGIFRLVVQADGGRGMVQEFCGDEEEWWLEFDTLEELSRYL